MNAEQLKAEQSPLKARYREDPNTALITLSAQGRPGEGVSCSLQTGQAMARVGRHPASGGDGQRLCSADTLLEALAACAGVTLNAVTTSLEIELRDARVRAEGELDFHGTLGMDKAAPVGFKSVHLRLEPGADARDEQVATLLKLTERYCVVLRTISSDPS